MTHDEAYSGVENLEVMQEARNYNNFLLATIRRHAPPKARTLDFGAGSGQFAFPLASEGVDVRALEPDQRLRDVLQKKGLMALGDQTEIAERSLDYIYTLNVLEHIEDDVSTLRGLRSKLTDEGRLLVYVPALPMLYTSMDAKVGHVRRYTRATLVDAVTQAGFSIERVAYVDCLGFFATLLFKAFDDQKGTINVRALKFYDRVAFPLSRALDLIAGRWFGKNLLLIARRTDSTSQLDAPQ